MQGSPFIWEQKEEKLADESASVGLLLNLIHGLVLALLCSAIMPSFLRMFTGDTQVIALACTYSTRVFAFAPVIGLELAYEKIFQAVGRMKVSMICMMLGCVTNIILDPVMIFGLGPVPKLGIAGAAYATGIGQCVTLAGYLLFYFARPMHVKVNVLGFGQSCREPAVGHIGHGHGEFDPGAVASERVPSEALNPKFPPSNIWFTETI